MKFYFWPETLPKLEAPRGSSRTMPMHQHELLFSARLTTPKGINLDVH